MSGVVFLTVEDLSETGGGSVATRELIRAIGTVSDDPLYVICPKPETDVPSRLERSVTEFRFLPRRTNPGSPSWHLKVEGRVFRHLVSLYRAKDPSLVVTRLSPSTLAPAPFCQSVNVPHVLLVRGWVNRHDEHSETKFASIVEQVVRLNVRLSDAVYVAFDDLREWVAQYRTDEQSPVEVLPNAVDPDLFTPQPMDEARGEIGLDTDAFVVGFVGSLAERHELPALLRAAAEHESVHVLIVGDGEIRSQLEELVRTEGLAGRVTFTGRVDHGDVPTYIAACDVTYGVVGTTRTSNPIKCYEYLACERPVITSSSPEMEFVDRIDAGQVLSEVTVPSVAGAIESLHSKPESDREVMGKRGREHVVENHTWERVAKTVCESGRGNV